MSMSRVEPCFVVRLCSSTELSLIILADISKNNSPWAAFSPFLPNDCYGDLRKLNLRKNLAWSPCRYGWPVTKTSAFYADHGQYTARAWTHIKISLLEGMIRHNSLCKYGFNWENAMVNVYWNESIWKEPVKTLNKWKKALQISTIYLQVGLFTHIA